LPFFDLWKNLYVKAWFVFLYSKKNVKAFQKMILHDIGEIWLNMGIGFIL